MPQAIRPDDYRIKPGAPVDLAALPTLPPFADPGKHPLRKVLKKRVRRFSKLQELLYAEGRRALLLVFQGMDASGKDSAIKFLVGQVMRETRGRADPNEAQAALRAVLDA